MSLPITAVGPLNVYEPDLHALLLRGAGIAANTVEHGGSTQERCATTSHPPRGTSVNRNTNGSVTPSKVPVRPETWAAMARIGPISRKGILPQSRNRETAERRPTNNGLSSRRSRLAAARTGSEILKLTTSADRALSGGTIATPKPAATKPGMLLELSPSKRDRRREAAALQRSSVIRRMAWPLLERTNGSSATFAAGPAGGAPAHGYAGRSERAPDRRRAPIRSRRGRAAPPRNEIELAAIELLLYRGAVVLHEIEAHARLGDPNRCTSSGMNLAPSVRRKPSATTPRSGLLSSASSRRPFSISPSACSTRARNNSPKRVSRSDRPARRTAARRGRLAAAPAPGSTTAGWCPAVRPRG